MAQFEVWIISCTITRRATRIPWKPAAGWYSGAAIRLLSSSIAKRATRIYSLSVSSHNINPSLPKTNGWLFSLTAAVLGLLMYRAPCSARRRMSLPCSRSAPPSTKASTTFHPSMDASMEASTAFHDLPPFHGGFHAGLHTFHGSLHTFHVTFHRMFNRMKDPACLEKCHMRFSSGANPGYFTPLSPSCVHPTQVRTQ